MAARLLISFRNIKTPIKCCYGSSGQCYYFDGQKIITLNTRKCSYKKIYYCHRFNTWKGMNLILKVNKIHKAQRKLSP